MKNSFSGQILISSANKMRGITCPLGNSRHNQCHGSRKLQAWDSQPEMILKLSVELVKTLD